MDLEGAAGILLVAFVAAAGAWVLVRLLGPIVTAFAERIRTPQSSLGKTEEEIRQLRAEVSELRAQRSSRLDTDGRAPAPIGGGDRTAV